MALNWKTKTISPTTLHLDPKNPRLGREHTSRAPREILQYLFDHDKVIEVAESIATRGFFANEPLLAVKENGRFVVLEGNRRLAALKVLREPALIDGKFRRQIERLTRRILDPSLIATVPVTIAPDRKSTDRQIAGRHVGTPVLAWRAENRASFILDKLAEGYDNDALRDELGFSLADIQSARQTRAIADMARSLDLPEEAKAKLEGPTAKVFTTLERVFESSAGREFLHVTTDPEHGLRGLTTKKEFIRGFRRLVEDVALGKQSSRSLNTNDDIRGYFESWEPADRPAKKQGSFIPADVVKEPSVASQLTEEVEPQPKPTKSESKTVLPKDFKIRHGNDRLIDIRGELIKLKREDFPNSGAVLLRVFFELSVLHYLQRTGELKSTIARIETKENRKLPFGVPTMKQLVPEVIRIAKEHLSPAEAAVVEKAVKYDQSAPFTISDLHGFVHSPDLPGERDIHQFWLRTEPLFRFMLEQDPKPASK